MRLAPGGVRLASLPAAGAIVLALLGFRIPATLLAVVAVGVLAVYRDPTRSPPPTGFVAPADGVVKSIHEADGRMHVAIFLNLWNVHVVRAPWSGRVLEIHRATGHRYPALLERAAANAGVHLDFGSGSVVLRAGLIARRVRTYVGLEETVDRGDRIGHITLGSRVDVTFPPGVGADAIAVEVGDRVRAGETVVAAAER